MRLHRLELAAFGPYADTVTVDFDALGADGLFLLYGDTGAGKTTVLDGIAYALFGQVPGARQKAGRLRCDHAEPSLAARVRLELTLGGRRLRVTRSPEWQRPKLRGPGTTTAPAKALLEIRREFRPGGGLPGDGELPRDGQLSRDGEWHGLSTRIDEVSHQLQDWLGMNAEQFFQVVLLPQGEFARFLRAESSEREELLERLFGTRRFSEAEAWLAARRRSAQGEVQGIEEQLSVLLARFCQAAGVPESATPALSDADAGWVTEIAAAAELSAGLTASQSAEAAVALAAAQEEYDEVAGLLRRQERLRAAGEARAAVEAGRSEQDSRQRVLDRARRAARVEPLVRSWRYAAEQASAAGAAVEDSQRSYALLSGLDGEVELPDGELTAAAAELRREIAVLGELRAAEESLPGLAAQVEAAESELASVLAAIAAESSRRAALPEEIAGARSAVAEAERAGQQADRWDEQVTRLGASLGAARELAIALDAEAAARGQSQAAVDEHQEAREAVLDLRQRRLAGIAAELAERLHDGDPCPVCGASEHPAPAEPADRITEADESAAAFAEDRARALRDAAGDALAACELDVARLSALAGGESAGDLAAQVADAEAELAAARSAAAGLGAAVRLLSALEAEAQRLAENELVLSGRAAGLRERHERSAAALAELRDRVASAAGDDPGLAARIARLTAAAESADALREARRVAAERSAAEARALGDAEREATAAGFAGLADAESAALPELELATLDDSVREFERADAATAAALADPELAGIPAGGELADPGPASEALAAARARA
ncbi:MAG: repair protein SbcC/Rad50, partial [Cryptosporangiaceae bacterium]|nr:repair protein SbcC/Rad50 [Cryptosporangiaceae bacterium]